MRSKSGGLWGTQSADPRTFSYRDVADDFGLSLSVGGVLLDPYFIDGDVSTDVGSKDRPSRLANEVSENLGMQLLVAVGDIGLHVADPWLIDVGESSEELEVFVCSRLESKGGGVKLGRGGGRGVGSEGRHGGADGGEAEGQRALYSGLNIL